MSNSNEDLFLNLIWLGLFGTFVITLFTLSFLALPFVAIAGGILYWYKSPHAQEQRARKHTHALYEDVKQRISVISKQEFRRAVIDGLPQGSTLDVLRADIQIICEKLYEDERFNNLHPPPEVCNSLEGARYRDYLSKQSTKENDESIRVAIDCLVYNFTRFLDHLPVLPSGEGLFEVPLSSYLAHPGIAIECLVFGLYDADALRLGLFEPVRQRLDRNIHTVSKVPLSEPDSPKLINPPEYKGDDVVDAYLRGTIFRHIFNAPVPFVFPEHIRFEHHWIVSPPGTGKSTTLQFLIERDLDKVARSEASIIVMESNRDLIKSIEGLARFGSGGDLEDRLIVVDMEDVEWPVAVSLFDVGLDEIRTPRDREALYNSAISMLDYVFRALLGAEMTSRQSTLFNFTIQLLLAIPGATLDTLLDLMTGELAYDRYLPSLDSDAQLFFKLKFNAREFNETRSQITDRLFAIKRNRTLSRMLNAPHTKLDFYREMGSSKVILINCAKSILQEEGVEIVSRFFLAMILLAAQKRQMLARDERPATYVYLDECQDIIYRDEKLPIILDQARKYNVAVILSHQRLQQMTPPVLNALYGSTAIKFAAGINDLTLARHMATTPEFILQQPRYSYAVHIRGTTDSAMSFRIPHVDFTRHPRMSR